MQYVRVFLIVEILFCCLHLKAQNSTEFYGLISDNPASYGTWNIRSANLISRYSQGLSAHFSNQGFSLNVENKKRIRKSCFKTGHGFNFQHFQSGYSQDTELNLMVNFQLPISARSRWRLSVGVSPGVSYQKNYPGNKPFQPPALPESGISRLNAVAGAGFFIYNPIFYLGFSAENFYVSKDDSLIALNDVCFQGTAGLYQWITRKIGTTITAGYEKQLEGGQYALYNIWTFSRYRGFYRNIRVGLGYASKSGLNVILGRESAGFSMIYAAGFDVHSSAEVPAVFHELKMSWRVPIGWSCVYGSLW